MFDAFPQKITNLLKNPISPYLIGNIAYATIVIQRHGPKPTNDNAPEVITSVYDSVMHVNHPSAHETLIVHGLQITMDALNSIRRVYYTSQISICNTIDCYKYYL